MFFCITLVTWRKLKFITAFLAMRYGNEERHPQTLDVMSFSYRAVRYDMSRVFLYI